MSSWSNNDSLRKRSANSSSVDLKRKHLRRSALPSNAVMLSLRLRDASSKPRLRNSDVKRKKGEGNRN